MKVARSVWRGQGVGDCPALPDKWAISVEEKRRLIELDNAELSILRQCQLVGLARSSFYYQPAGESPLNETLMRLIDIRYTEKPFLGSPRMTDWLCECGYHVNHKRVERLMRKMGLQAIGPKPTPKTSLVGDPKRKFPYLLNRVTVERPNQVWATDITIFR